MSGKSDTTRINDTLTMIGQAAILTPPIRTAIVNLVNGQFPRLTAADLTAYSQLSAEMSVKNQITAGVAKGNAAEREMRRAIVLLWTAIAKAQVQPTPMAKTQPAMSIGAGVLPAAFSEAMLKAAVVASPQGAQHMFNELSLHPVRFLTTNRIMIRGSAVGGDRFSSAPTGNYQNVCQFYFQYDVAQDRFILGAGADVQLGASHPFTTVSVPAVHWSAVPGVGAAPYNFAGVLGCELTGASFMVTTQFTGCTFNWTNHGGMLRASHVSPSGGGPLTYPGGGIALAQRMMANGAMANAGGTAVAAFGPGAGNAPPVGGGNSFYPNPAANVIRWVSIFGVVKGGAWRLYSQTIGGALQILEPRRIM